MNLLSGKSILNSSFEEPTHTGTVGRGESASGSELAF